jgi:hypothetical protein
MSGSAHERNVARKALLAELGGILDEKFADLKCQLQPVAFRSEPQRFSSTMRWWLSPILLSSTGLITANYWVGVLSFYAGVVVTTWEVIVGADFKSRRFIKVLFVGVLLLLTTLFTASVVLVHVPMEALAEYRWSAPSPGTDVGGFVWKTQYGELRLTLLNSTDYDFTDVDLNIKPDQPVAKIGQLSQIADVSFLTPDNQEAFAGGNGMTIAMPEMGTVGPDGRIQDLPAHIEYSLGGFRVKCGSVPKHSTLDLVLATTGPKGNHLTGEGRSYNLADDTNLEPKEPSKVELHGSYVAVLRRRSFDKTVTVPTNQPWH